MEQAILSRVLDEQKIVIPEGKKLYIYGTGNSADLYQNGLKRIELDIAGYCVDYDYLGGVMSTMDI